jgi:hypothetical protein
MSTAVIAPPMSATEALSFLDENRSLMNIRTKLADPEEGKGYKPEHLDLLEQENCRFLAMHLAHPDAEIVPCELVDEMWHAHILDTIAHRHDCDALFGDFLDHFPYFGMRGDDDAQALSDAYGDTLKIYEQDFGAPPA